MSRNPITLALDLPDRERALAIARSVAPHVGMFKVGLQSYVGHGPAFLEEIMALGLPVFLDLKLHDIPMQVERACRQVAKLGVSMVTVHASGGSSMIKAAKEGVGDACQVVAVTVLTSMDEVDGAEIGYGRPIGQQVIRLAELSLRNGADGVVCSGLELSALTHLDGVRVVPGIRVASTSGDDQARVMTPEEALGAGATWMVIGRPICEASDPAEAAVAIEARVR